MSTEDKALSRKTSEAIVAMLAEVISSDEFDTFAGPAMGFDGVNVHHKATGGDFYFDTTWGGDDGYAPYVRFYCTTECGNPLDVETSDGNPLLSDGPLVIAKWIMSQVEEGVRRVSEFSADKP
jgi:hypothetical protein